MEIIIENEESMETETVTTKENIKRSPWAKRQIENIHATPAGPCISIKDKFNNYIDENYRMMTNDVRINLWNKVSKTMLTTPLNKINDVIEKNIL